MSEFYSKVLPELQLYLSFAWQLEYQTENYMRQNVSECFINENVENVLTRIKIIISNLIESPLSQKSIHLKVCNGLDKG